MRKPVASLLCSCLLLTGCPDSPVPSTPAPSDPFASRNNRSTPLPPETPDTGAQQVRMREPIVPLPENSAPPPLASPAVITPLEEGGALLVWGGAAADGRPASTIVARKIERDGTLGSIRTVRATRGIVRSVDAAAYGDQVLVAWNADIAGLTSHASFSRIRPGTNVSVGGVTPLGLFRVNEPGADAGSDPIGFPIAVIANQQGWVVSLRGAPQPCGTATCRSVRTVEVTNEGEVLPRGGFEHFSPRQPLLLIGSREQPYTLLVNVGGNGAPEEVRSHGSGLLSRISIPSGSSVLTGWTDRTEGFALVQSTPFSNAPAPRGRPEASLVRSNAGDSGAQQPLRLERARLLCVEGVPNTELSFRGTALRVPVTAAGGANLALWIQQTNWFSFARNARTASPVLAAGWTGALYVVATSTGLQNFRCEGAELRAAQ